MTTATCYGGISEIGGNKILIEDKKTRIFLDFGASFDLLDEYFVEYLQPRTRFGLRDYFALDLIPKLPGLFNEWAISKTDVEYKEPEYHGILVSHPHYDHIAHLKYVDQKIPIYIGETAKNIITSVNEISNTSYLNEKPVYMRGGGTIPPNKINMFRTGDKIKIDDIEIEPIHVDHSVPGAYGFIIHTSEGTIVYTGDLRRHGTKPELTSDFIAKAKQSDPVLLIIEGTRVAPEETRKNYSESEVCLRGQTLAKENNGLVIAMRYPKDIDRFRTFYDIAKASGKQLVISLKTAQFMLSLKNDKALALPNPFVDEFIKIYKREMKIYKDWEIPLLDRCVDWQWIKENQKKIIWEMEFFHLTELIDIQPEKGGVCIHSMSEPFEEDPLSQLQDNVMQSWLDRFGIRHEQLHASGHASMDEIFDMIKEINPKNVLPVHTKYPKLFENCGKNALLLKKGEKFEV
ncbi:MAG: MBL fold metallo-hydrolase [Candidatus Micrarchaeota archaeon]